MVSKAQTMRPSIKPLLRGVGFRPAWKLPDLSQEQILQRAQTLSRAEYAKDLRALITRKVEDLRYYDVPNMERAVAVCHWGRSGSWLVDSYLDGHDDVVLLAMAAALKSMNSLNATSRCLCMTSLSLTRSIWPMFLFFFKEISRSLQQIIMPQWPQYLKFMATARHSFSKHAEAFFQFLHVAYNLALGRRPTSPRPLMVFDQHWRHDETAGRFVEDFPQARFLHTVRDPISSYDRTFEYFYGTCGRRNPMADAPVLFTNSDVPYLGMETRTRAIRFEDLHTNAAEIMSRLADWLGLPYQASLLKSTFNGMPWVVGRAGVNWSGPRPEQALRSSRNISFTDKIILFAMFYENFVAWNYSCPRIFRHALVRGFACMLVFLIPMKTETISARAVVKAKVLPSLRHGDFRLAFKSLFGIFRCRLAMIYCVTSEIWRRLVFGKTVLEIF